MTIKFNKSEEYTKAKAALVDAFKEGDDSAQAKAFEGFVDAMKDDVTAAISREANDVMMDRSIIQNRGGNVLTAEETRFFQNGIDKKGFDDDSILPVTTQQRIFEGIVNEHPLLNALGLQDLGAVTRYIYSDAEKNFVWGELFGPIQGQ